MPRKSWYKVSIIYRSALAILSTYLTIEAILAGEGLISISLGFIAIFFWSLLAIIAWKRKRKAKP